MSRGGLTAAAAAALATARPALPVRRWDHKTPPARLALLERRFALTAAEREHLLRDGFVVPERLADTDYALALHEVFQSQLPLFISADAILHAIYASNDKLLARLEGAMARPVAATPVGQEAGAAPAPGAEGGGDPATDDVPEAADDQAEGDSRKAVNA